MTAETDSGADSAWRSRPFRGAAFSAVVAVARQSWARLRFHTSFSSITARIVVLNILALGCLVGGIFYFSSSYGGLIEARVKTMLTQGEIIAGAIEQSATPGSESAIAAAAARDPFGEIQSGLFEARAGETGAALSANLDQVQLITLLRKLARPTGAHARVYDAAGNLVADSARLYTKGEIVGLDIAATPSPALGLRERAWNWFWGLFREGDQRVYRDIGMENGRSYPEVSAALGGTATPSVGVSEAGETIISVAVPIERGARPLGALMLATHGGDIDRVIGRERAGILQAFGYVALVTLAISLLLAATIAGPLHKLAKSADRVRENIRARTVIPDFAHRKDEVGHLGRAFSEMTAALYSRIDAIEAFAADVAHELKNPLTSLRSATETLPLARTPEDTGRLNAIIAHDIRRLNRLISDISDASRLDGEMAREQTRPINLARLLETICTICNEIHREGIPGIDLKIETGPLREGPGAFIVNGHDSRLSQVVNNLLDNAKSFSPPGGRIIVTARVLRKLKQIEVTIEDDGMGVPPENLEKIFTRFYTDRPEPESFGQNSGLGLHISRHIIEAHRGRIWAENRPPRNGQTGSGGARFVIRLPARHLT